MSAHAIAIPDPRPLVVLDEERHVYTHRDGFVPPSVTTILGSVPPWLGQFDHANPEDVAYKAMLGRQVHRATHYDDEGTLDASSVAEAIAPYLDAWRLFKVQSGFAPVQMETAIYHPVYGYAGTFDRVGLVGGGPVLLDIKTGVGSMAGPQTAAYLDAWRAMRVAGQMPDCPIPAAAPFERWTVQLKDSGRYVITPHKDRRDWPVFQAALTLWSYAHDRTRRY